MTLTIEAILDATPDLPSMSEAAYEVIRLTGEDIPAAALAEAVSRDPGIAIRVLRAANGAWYGGAPLTSLSQAILRLGLPAVKRLATTAAAAPWLGQSLPGLKAGPGALARSGLAAGLGAQKTAALCRRAEEATAFTSGLLSDVGLAVLSLAAGPKLAPIQRIGEREGLTLAEAELKVLGFTHSELGARMLERWGLPDAIWMPIIAQDSPGAADSPPSEDALRVGRLAAAAVRAALRPAGLRVENHLEPVTRLGFDLRQLQRLAEDVKKDMSQYQGAAA
jgi:HD-like signal output (HDOD) protein